MQYIHIFALATANNITFFTNLLNKAPSINYKKTEGDLIKIDEFGKEVLLSPVNSNAKSIFLGISKDFYDQTDFSIVEGNFQSFCLEEYREIWANLDATYQKVDLINNEDKYDNEN